MGSNSRALALRQKLRELHRPDHLSNVFGTFGKCLAETRDIPVLGTTLAYERYGPCHWTKIRFLKEGEEVYKLTRRGETRREYFFGSMFRRYEGSQFCFCEYLGLVIRIGNPEPPLREELEANLGERVTAGYRRYARRILGISGSSS